MENIAQTMMMMSIMMYDISLQFEGGYCYRANIPKIFDVAKCFWSLFLQIVEQSHEAIADFDGKAVGDDAA